MAEHPMEKHHTVAATANVILTTQQLMYNIFPRVVRGLLYVQVIIYFPSWVGLSYLIGQYYSFGMLTASEVS